MFEISGPETPIPGDILGLIGYTDEQNTYRPV